MNVYYIGSANDCCCYVRMYMPCMANGYWCDTSGGKRKTPKQVMEDLAKSDVVVLHRPENEDYRKLITMLKADGKKVVIDNDDTFKIADDHPLAVWTSDAAKVELKDRDKTFDDLASQADLLTTSTEFLADEYRKINKNVVVLPNCVDPMDWDDVLPKKEGKIRIGIVGSVSYEYDYAHIKWLIKELSEREDVELVLFGLGDKKHRYENPAVTAHFEQEYNFWDDIKKEHISWCPVKEYPTKLNEAQLDAMLIPRRDNYFNRCKSNIKWLEASMAGIAVFAEKFSDGKGPYDQCIEDGKTGYLIDDWKRVLTLLDKKTLNKIGLNARKKVLKDYDINKKASLWENAYNKLYENN